jgi:PPP family 3-phenylpropionic acid transporter
VGTLDDRLGAPRRALVDRPRARVGPDGHGDRADANRPRTLNGTSTARLDSLLRFVVLYALLYGAFGISSPFLPRFFETRGLTPQQIGLVVGLGTAIRLLAGPLAGRSADLLGALRLVLATCILAAACVAIALVHATGFWMVLVVSLIDAAVLAPTTTLADALTLGAAVPRHPGGARFEYGWVRGSASAAFIVGSLVAGQVVGTASLDAILWIHAGLLAVAAIAVAFVPPLDAGTSPTAIERSPAGGIRLLLRVAPFRRLVVVAALVLGSHAMHDGFAMVRWNAAGIGPAAGSVLWSESVVAEVVVFFLIGPLLVDRLGAGRAMALAATAGIVRWVAMASTASVAVLAVVQPLHGFTFALLHLACMRLVAATVPRHLAATAQSIYAVGATAMTALMSVVAGALYARAGSVGFLAMALLCAVALPLAAGIGRAPLHDPRAAEPS